MRWVQLHPQIFRRTDFDNFHSKVTLLSVFLSISENLYPQLLNPKEDPGEAVLMYSVFVNLNPLMLSVVRFSVKDERFSMKIFKDHIKI